MFTLLLSFVYIKKPIIYSSTEYITLTFLIFVKRASINYVGKIFPIFDPPPIVGKHRWHLATPVYVCIFPFF